MITRHNFPRSVRLLTAAEYRRVFAKPERSADSFFTILARKNGGKSARLGLAIAKKNVRRAVDRNRIKRLVRESFRFQQQSLAGLDLVVLARQGTANQDNSRLHASLTEHWLRLETL